jgi:hypothetical protein
MICFAGQYYWNCLIAKNNKEVIFYFLEDMFGVENHSLSRNKQSEKQIRFGAREGVFWLPDAEILVVWKGKVVRMRANQIGDGMLVPLLFEREVVKVADRSWVVNWLSLYQEYDEDNDSWQTFLWKYPWGEWGMQAINNVSNQHNLGIFIEKIGKFVQVTWATPFSRDWSSPSVQEALWFLIGICLWYGAPKNKTDQTISTWQVNVPCLWEIMRHEALIKNALEVCREQGILLIHSDVKQRDLTVWNWTIHDVELVAFLRAVWTDMRPVSVLQSTSEGLIVDYLEENGVKWDYVLKFVGK